VIRGRNPSGPNHGPLAPFNLESGEATAAREGGARPAPLEASTEAGNAASSEAVAGGEAADSADSAALADPASRWKSERRNNNLDPVPSNIFVFFFVFFKAITVQPFGGTGTHTVASFFSPFFKDLTLPVPAV
jgi:hypothetical protein